jgi:hypothetical protein
MIKISLCILAVYLMYYAGNIAYDLFLKKEKGTSQEETEEFSLSEISEQYEDLTKNIGIEDVENLNTPKSFQKNQIHSDFTEGKDERQNLEYLRELFESEKDLDEANNAPKKDYAENENQSYSEKTESSEIHLDQSETTATEQESQQPIEEFQQNRILDKKNEKTSKTNDWKKMLNLSETMVQLVANHNGYKTYQSIM